MQVWHMSGAGNDFMVMDARGGAHDFSALSKKLCAMSGADGFMAADGSDTADFRLHFYNPDGSRGEMCGNGCRCVCRFAHAMGLVGDTMTVQTDAGPVYAKRLDESHYRVRLNNPGIVDLNRKDGVAYVELGTPGIPHAVTELPGFDWSVAEPLRGRAKALRYDPAFPKGVNVNFYSWLDSETVRILTYERGVEDYTLACGTGSASTAVTLWLQGKLPNGRLQAENRGGMLTLELRGKNGTVEELWLEGPTEILKIYEL